MVSPASLFFYFNRYTQGIDTMKKSSLLVIALIALAVIGVYNMMTGSQPEAVPAASVETAPPVAEQPASAPAPADAAPATESTAPVGGTMAPEAASPMEQNATDPAVPAAEAPAAPAQQ